jgi:hypothetical protein
MTRDIYASVSVVEPVGKAIEEVKTILFSPFNLEKWFTIGFCAWLTFMSLIIPGFQEIIGSVREEKEWVITNLTWLIPLTCFVVTLIILIGLVLSWLSSRGQFMFLHCVAKNKAEVSIPWTKYASHGNSLFLFRIVFGLIAFVIIVLYMVAVGLGIFFLAGGMGGAHEVSAPVILGIIVGGIGYVMLLILFVVIYRFTLDFVVPIMYLRMIPCTTAWREFLEIVSARKGALFVYLLFQIVIGIAVSAVVLAFALVTCCCACCFMMIPYIGTVILLPILVFERAYSLHYLRQFGSDFDVFIPEPQDTPVPVIVM